MSNGETKTHTIETESCGHLQVYVQGDLTQADKKAVFLTVHDLGCNHTSFHEFVDHPSMGEVKGRSIFIHVDVPGQEDNAENLKDEFTFPTMQQLGESLATILDIFHIKFVIGLGEGAGANILARFAMSHPARCLGLVLIHCTSTVAGLMETVKDKFINWKLTMVGHNPSAEEYLIFHRFGEKMDKAEDKSKAVEEFRSKLKSRINPRNLKQYVESFLNRSDLSTILRSKLKIDTLLVSGSRASYLHTVDTMYSHCDPGKTQLIKIDGVGDPINESPEKLAQSLVLFIQSLGLFSSVLPPNIVRSPSMEAEESAVPPARVGRRLSMEEQDRPNIQRLLSHERRESVSEAAITE